MIRRGFWLLAGAVLGVSGYRKATRLGRTLTGQSLLRVPVATKHRPAVRLAPPGQLGAGQPGADQPAGIATAAARAAAAAGFVRDVRTGMAEYWDLHRSESDRTLGNQRDRIGSGDS